MPKLSHTVYRNITTAYMKTESPRIKDWKSFDSCAKAPMAKRGKKCYGDENASLPRMIFSSLKLESKMVLT